MTEIESLGIAITADTKDAGKAIDNLVAKLGILSNSLSRVNGSNLTGLGQGVQDLAQGMHSLKGIGDKKYIKLANGLSLIANVNAQGLDNAANSLANFAKSTSLLSGIQFDNKNIQNLINSLTRLANSKVDSLSNVDFTRLGASLNGLATSLQNAPKIQQSIISMTNAIANLSRFGGNIPTVASSLGALGNSLTMFMSTMANAPRITDNALAFTQAISSLAGAGAKAGVTASNLSALGVGIRNIMTTLSTAPKVSQNVIDMTNALANLSAQGSKVGSASRNMVYGLNRTSRSADRAKKSFSGLASVIGKFYANYFLVVRGFKALWKSIGSTADYIESYNYFNVALGKIGSDWAHQWEKYADKIGVSSAEEYADSFATRLEDKLKPLSGISVEVGADGKGLLSTTGMKNLGLNIQEVTQYASQLASVTNSLGQTGEVSLATSSAFTKLGADMASLYNKDYSEVMGNLQSGLIGQSRALYKYGIDITNATLQTYAYELGLSKAVSEMTQAEKQQLRMIAILDQSRVSWGDLANTIESPSNLMRQFKNNLKETGMVLGQLFIPMLQYTLPVINGVTIAIKELLVSLAQLAGITIDFNAFGEGFNQTEGFEDLQEGIDGATESLKKYKNQAMDFDEINPIKGVDDSANLGNLTGGSIDLTDEILKATEEYEKAWQESYDNMESRSQEIANRIVNGFKNAFKNAGWYGVGNYISSGIADSLANADFDSVHKGLENVARNMANFLNGLITPDLLGNVGESFAKSLNAVINAKATLGENINFDQVGEAIATGVNNFFDTFDFGRLGESINTWVKGLTKALIEAVKNIDWNDIIKGFAELITSLDPETILILTSLWFLRGGGLPGLPGLPNIGGGGNQSGGSSGAWGLAAMPLMKYLVPLGKIAAAVVGGAWGGNKFGEYLSGDKELYEKYNLWESLKVIVPEFFENPEEVYDAGTKALGWFGEKILDGLHYIGLVTQDATSEDSTINRVIAAGHKPVIEGVDYLLGENGLIDEADKKLFPWWDDFLEYYGLKKPEETKPETKPVGLETFVTGLDISKLEKYEKFFPFLSIVSSQETSKNPSSLINENVFSQVGDWDTFMSSVYDELSVKMSVKWQLGGREIDFLGIGEEMKKQGASMAWNIGQGILNDKSSKSAISILVQGLKDVLGGKSGSIIEFAKSFGVNIVKFLGFGLENNTYAKTALDNVLNNVKSVFGNNTIIDTALAKGKSIIWNLGKGITDGKATATTPLTNVITSMINIITGSNLFEKFKQVGKFIVDGIISGINDPKQTASLATTMVNLGTNVITSFTDFMQIHSPSRLFMKYGQYTVEGYNLGIQKYAPTTLDSMEDWSGSIADTSFSMETPSVNANSEELLLLRQQNMLLQALLNKETVEIKGDAKQIFKVVQKQANNYTIQTGEPAFSF